MLVTVFAYLLHLRQVCNCSYTRTRASARNKNSVYLDSYLASINFVPPISLRSYGAQRDTCIVHKVCTRTAKTARYSPCLPAAVRQACTPAAHYARAGRGAKAFWPTGTDSWRCFHRVTLTEPYRRLGTIGRKLQHIQRSMRNLPNFCNFVIK